MPQGGDARPASARVGLVRLVGLVGVSSYGIQPRQADDEVLAHTATAYYASGWIDEFAQAIASGQEAALLTNFGNKPLVVLTAGAETDATHNAAQNKLAALSTNSSHRTIEGAKHVSLIVEKKYAEATTQAVLDVVSSVRNAGQQIR